MFFPSFLLFTILFLLSIPFSCFLLSHWPPYHAECLPHRPHIHHHIFILAWSNLSVSFATVLIFFRF
jgi:hypothetical protein